MLVILDFCNLDFLKLICDKISESVSHSLVRLFVKPRTVACEVPLSMVFSFPGKNTGVGCHSPGDIPKPRMEPRSAALKQIVYHLSHQDMIFFKSYNSKQFKDLL